jgi:hypothetical protein
MVNKILDKITQNSLILEGRGGGERENVFGCPAMSRDSHEYYAPNVSVNIGLFL